MAKESDRGRYASPEGSQIWEYMATMSCSLLIFCVGCVPGWNSPSLAILMDPKNTSPMSASTASTLSATIALGHAVAPTLTIVMANKLGRKNSLLATGIPTILSWGLIAVSENIIVLFVARFIAGLSLGLIYCFPQMYLGEIASAKLRGAISMVCGTMINTGVLFMFAAAPYLSITKMACICLSIVTVAVISVWFIPESPYYLAMIGKIDEAEAQLEKLRGKTDVAEELELIKMTISQKGKNRSSLGDGEAQETEKKPSAYKQLFSVPGNRKALIINFLFPTVLFFGSYISTMTYGQIIFDKMNTGVTGHVCMMIIAIVQIVCNILTTFVIDRLGRKPLICVSGVLSGVLLSIPAVYFYLMEYTKVDVTPYGMIALSALIVNAVVLNFGLVPLQHVIQSEILATEVKEFATCLIGVVGGVMGTLGVKSYLMLAETWGLGHSTPFISFVVVTWAGTALILKLLPETKGKTLFEIQKDLNA